MSTYEYTHPHSTPASHPTSHKSRSSSNKYTPAKIESDLRKTLSFLARTLQNEFLNPPPSSSHRSAGAGSSEKGELNFEEILLKGRKKVEKLVRKWNEVNPSSPSSSSIPGRVHAQEQTAYNSTRQQESPYWQSPDEIEEVESVRSRSKHRRQPRAPSPPGASTTRDANDWAGVNPDYSSSSSHAHDHYPSYPGEANSTQKPTIKRSKTGLGALGFNSEAIRNLNLPSLIAHAGIILGVIEKVLTMRSGHGGYSNSRGVKGHGSGDGSKLATAVKVVKLVVAVGEGLGLGKEGGAQSGGARRERY